jgi:hypothetical protein
VAKLRFPGEDRVPRNVAEVLGDEVRHGSRGRRGVKVSDDGAEEPGAGVDKAMLASDLEVEIAVRTGDRVAPNGFGRGAGGETDVLR